jgi:hypothetical protein
MQVQFKPALMPAANPNPSLRSHSNLTASNPQADAFVSTEFGVSRRQVLLGSAVLVLTRLLGGCDKKDDTTCTPIAASQTQTTTKAPNGQEAKKTDTVVVGVCP